MSLELNDILVPILIALVAWIGKRLHDKIDALEKTVQDMAVKNAHDHAVVVKDIEVLKAKIDDMHDNS